MMVEDVRQEVGARSRAGRAGKSAAAFRTISEVAGELDVAQHVLRFWESKFPQVRPLKRGGGRRYYRPEDVELLRQIRSLLYDEGYTIKGAQKLLKAHRRPGAEHVEDDDHAGRAEAAAEPAATGGHDGAVEADGRQRLARVRADLVAMRDDLVRVLG
jgi:DNA-binding transcriptional MerR regulator